MSRLSSLRGPSAPSSPSSSGRSPPLSPSQQPHPTHSLLSSAASSTSPHSPPAKTPLQPASIDPSPQHRKCRAVLVEVERTLRDWEAVVRVDGGKAGKALIDARTELDNLAFAQKANTYAYEPAQLPSDLLARLAQASADLSAALLKLDKRLAKLSTLAAAAEQLVLESLRTRGAGFTQAGALWTTWSLEHFSASLSPLLAALHHSHAVLRSLATTLLAPSCSFTAGKEALEAWLREGAFEEGWRFGLLSGAGGVGGGGGGRREWAECMGVEVRGWDEAFRFGAR